MLLPKTTSFDATQRVLSHDMPEIVISKTNAKIRFGKLVKQALKEIFYLPIRFRTCATFETYFIQLNLKSSIDWCVFHPYKEETHNSNFSKTLDTSYRKMGTPISYTKACIMSKSYIISWISFSSIDWSMICCKQHSFSNIKIFKNLSFKITI